MGEFATPLLRGENRSNEDDKNNADWRSVSGGDGSDRG